ncbi:mechanosensitive ion channel family protein [Emcibacter sp.]|uniref:mechanosensitive ion channel family protein n=1 Tax=Emcibacter sp. TaxID=1979954 RepID=UPI002AA88521|nr:mechanosensitive ion channel domain-containing protein [Emcibacter sp.]
MENTMAILMAQLEHIAEFLPRLGASVLIFLIIYFIGKLCGHLLLTLLKRGDLSPTHREFFRKLVVGLFVFIGAAVVLNIWGLRAASLGLLTGGGITALAIGIAFKDIGENILAGIYLAFSRPFNINDLVLTGDIEGVVKNVEMRCTHIRTDKGADVYVPNAQIFAQPLVNYTLDGLRRLSFTIGIDYMDDTERACGLLNGVVQATKGVLSDPASVVVISGFTPQYVELQVFYWINTFENGADIPAIRNNVMNSCREVLISNKFTFSSDVKTANVLSVPEPVRVLSGEGN